MNAPSEPIPTRTPRRFSPLVQLILARIREFYREPEAMFWVYGFPLLMATALGIAFRNKPVERIAVDVIEHPGAQGVSDALRKDERFVIEVNDEATARRRLRTAKTAVVVQVASQDDDRLKSLHYLYDANRPESLLARNATDDALQRAAGRIDLVEASDVSFDEPGGRYIDFLVPGLIGMSLMGGGLWGVGFVIVDMRIRKLLKRFLATPMRKTDFLLAIMASRLIFYIPEFLVLLVFARFAFGVQLHGNVFALLALILLGAAAFAGIGLLVASRAKTLEAVSGLMNLVMLPMWVLSGIFFSSERFPDSAQPFIRVLPLTMLIDALRAVILDGLPLHSQWYSIVGLSLWGTITFGLALVLFRWK